MPTIDRIIHVNLVCSNLSRSLDFYEGVLGGTVVQHLDDGGVDLRPAMGLGHDAARRYSAALVSWGDAKRGPYVDLLQWHGDAGDVLSADRPSAAQDLGLARVCLGLDDADGMLQHLRDHGVPIVGPYEDTVPVTTIGPWQVKVLFCHDPDGTLVELMEFPRG